MVINTYLRNSAILVNCFKVVLGFQFYSSKVRFYLISKLIIFDIFISSLMNKRDITKRME